MPMPLKIPNIPTVTTLARNATALAVFVTLTACGGDKNNSEDSTSPPEGQAYQDKVQAQVKDSIVNSLSREWNISREKVQCLLANHRASQLANVASDPKLQAVFKSCGVDPAVVES